VGEVSIILSSFFNKILNLEFEVILYFLIYSAVIFISRIIIKAIIKKSFKNKEKIKDVLISLLNWLTFYGYLVFVLNYFSESKWMFEKLFSIGESEISLFLIIILLFIITFTNSLAKLMKKFILPNVYDKYQLDRSIRYTFNSIFQYFILVIVVLISLATLGINLSSLAVFASVLGVGIGFGLQNIASNFISGIILLFERPIKVGDRVLVDDIIGDVIEIKMRATVVKTLNNEHMIIPNSFFLEEKVMNRSYGDAKVRIDVPVGVSYSSDVFLVKNLLLQVVENISAINKDVLTQPEPKVNFLGFGDSSLDFELFMWIKDPYNSVSIKSDIRFEIFKIFEENNIEIPFPQQDLHIKTIDKDAVLKTNENK
jgi:small-conductance mechanosensitive channel